MPAFFLQLVVRHRARYHDGALQRQWSPGYPVVQMFGHETIAGEYDLLCDQAAVCGLQSVYAILLVPVEHFAVGVYSGPPAFRGSGQAECISKWM